ncbi:hypothetical protein D3C72_2170000 [compost metagenome]
MHSGVRGQREGADGCSVQPQIWATEEKSGVRGAIGSKTVVRLPGLRPLRLSESMDVVVVA